MPQVRRHEPEHEPEPEQAAEEVKPGANVPPLVSETYTEGVEHGYIGTPPDETPNESYTVEGVLKARASE